MAQVIDKNGKVNWIALLTPFLSAGAGALLGGKEGAAVGFNAGANVVSGAIDAQEMKRRRRIEDDDREETRKDRAEARKDREAARAWGPMLRQAADRKNKRGPSDPGKGSGIRLRQWSGRVERFGCCFVRGFARDS